MPEYLRSMPVVTSANASKVLLLLLLPLPPAMLAVCLVTARVRRNNATPRLTAVWSECPETPPSSNVKIWKVQNKTKRGTHGNQFWIR